MLIICDLYKKANIVKEISYCYNSGLVVVCVFWCFLVCFLLVWLVGLVPLQTEGVNIMKSNAGIKPDILCFCKNMSSFSK